MNAYITNHHTLNDSIDEDPDAGDEHDTHMIQPRKKNEGGGRTTAIPKEGTVSSHKDDPLPSSIAMAKQRSGPRSSKYKEVNGSAFFSESSPTMGMQSPMWTYTDKNTVTPRSNRNVLMRGLKASIDGKEGNGHKGHLRASPQAVVDYDKM